MRIQCIFHRTESNGLTPSQRRWRERLLGSLQGQLQLATYLVVFAGFTRASAMGLWVGQRNPIHYETQTMRSSTLSIQASLSRAFNLMNEHQLQHNWLT